MCVFICCNIGYYGNRQIRGTLALAHVRRTLYYQMIKENLLAKFSLDQQNVHKRCVFIEDDLCNCRLQTD